MILTFTFTIAPLTCEDGKYYGDACDPTVYYQCVHGSSLRNECPSGLVWDASTDTCNWDYLVPTDTETAATTTGAAETTTATSAEATTTEAPTTTEENQDDNCGEYCKKSLKKLKGVIRIRKSKDRQHNGQKKKDKRVKADLQNIHIKLKIKQHEPHQKPGVNSGAPEG